MFCYSQFYRSSYRLSASCWQRRSAASHSSMSILNNSLEAYRNMQDLAISVVQLVAYEAACRMSWLMYTVKSIVKSTTPSWPLSGAGGPPLTFRDRPERRLDEDRPVRHWAACSLQQSTCRDCLVF